MAEHVLKDKELLKKFAAIWPDFETKLREASKYAAFFDGVEVDFETIQVYIDWSLLEETRSYDPYGWNDYPDKTPPEHVVLAVECQNENGDIDGFSAYYVDGNWFHSDARSAKAPFPIQTGSRVIRFRSWY